MKLSSISCTVITLAALTCSTTALPVKPENLKAPLGAARSVHGRDLEDGRLFRRSHYHQHRGHGHGPVDEVPSEAALSSRDLDDGRLFVRSSHQHHGHQSHRHGPFAEASPSDGHHSHGHGQRHGHPGQSHKHAPVDEVPSDAAISSRDLEDGRLFTRSPHQHHGHQFHGHGPLAGALPSNGHHPHTHGHVAEAPSDATISSRDLEDGRLFTRSAHQHHGHQPHGHGPVAGALPSDGHHPHTHGHVAEASSDAAIFSRDLEGRLFTRSSHQHHGHQFHGHGSVAGAPPSDGHHSHGHNLVAEAPSDEAISSRDLEGRLFTRCSHHDHHQRRHSNKHAATTVPPDEAGVTDAA